MGFWWPTQLDRIELAVHQTSLRLESLMGAVQDAVDQIVAQLAKAQAEIVDKIADLEAQVAAGETPDFTALKAAAQALDDVVPDVEEPGDEPPVVVE